jgi:hypothetical protein
MREFSIAVVLTCVALTVFAQPKIEIVGGNKFDFGNIYRGKTVEHKVIARNIGNKTLELGRIDVSCGCTGTVGANTTIAPKKTGEVVITFNSTNFSGKIHKTVTINSNAENAPQTMIEFEGNVVQEIAVSPAQFWFRDAEVNRPTTSKITLTNNSAEPVSLTGFTSNLDGLQITLPSAAIKPGESVELVAELKAKVSTQVLNERVAIKTTSKNEPEVQVLIFGAVKEFKFQ